MVSVHVNRKADALRQIDTDSGAHSEGHIGKARVLVDHAERVEGLAGAARPTTERRCDIHQCRISLALLQQEAPKLGKREEAGGERPHPGQPEAQQQYRQTPTMLSHYAVTRPTTSRTLGRQSRDVVL
jgi:hypothetical protein